MPPRMPCAITVPSAEKPKMRIQRRFSERHVQTARMIVSSPAPWAIMRWVCSNFTPPTSFGILYQEPNEVGQSGTERPASLLVTKAPAMISKKVQQARRTANRWRPGLYLVAMAFRAMPLGSQSLAERYRSAASCGDGATTTRYFIKTKWLLAGCGLEALVDGLGLFGSDGHLLVLLAQFFVDEREGVIARRQALDFIFPIFVGDGEERALHHVDVHLHPRMLVALYRQHDLFACEGLLERGRRWRLRFVPLTVVFRRGMDVVSSGIVVLDLHRLAGHHAQHMRMVLAAFLVEHDGVLGKVEGAVAEAVFHVNEDVGQIASADPDVFSLVGPLAAGVLAHVDFRRLGSG